MGLEKLVITYEEQQADQFTGRIVAMFNPSELTFSRAANWHKRAVASRGNPYRLRFTGREPDRLSLNLFFNTYRAERSTGSLLGGLDGIGSTLPLGSASEIAPPTSVTTYTQQVLDLTRLNNELHRPPLCQLQWGQTHLFKGVLASLEESFTLFLEDGTPVRATLACTFEQHLNRFDDGVDLHSADVPKTRIVQRGDTLSSLAAAEYNDPAQWRHIAVANGIRNPRLLRPGQVLQLPKL